MTPTPLNSPSPVSNQTGASWNQTVMPQPSRPKRFLWNSIGTRLFIPIVGGALVGIGGIAFISTEVVKYQTEAQIRRSLSDKTEIINGTLNQAEQVANSLKTSVLALRSNRVGSAETYRRLMFEQFKARPDFIVGLGLGQRENGILPNQKWFSPYYSVDFGEPNAPGITFSAPYDDVRYVDGTQPRQFYPDSKRYKNYFFPQKNTWSPPFEVNEHIKTTFYSQITDDANTWLGTIFVDLDKAAFDQAINASVVNQAGFFLLLDQNGSVIAAPDGEKMVEGADTFAAIPDLNALWTQMQDQAGFIEGENGYWAYRRVNDENWVALAYVPYPAVFGRIALVTVSETIMVGALLALILALRLRSLSRRLRPVLEECDHVATQAPALAAAQHKDEVDRLSATFFYLSDQAKRNQEQLDQEATSSVRLEERLRKLAIAEQESHLLLEDVENLLDVVSAVEKGNLTVSAQISPRATGLVANALNRSIAQLDQTMAAVFNTTEHVSFSADKLEHLVDAIAEDAKQQTQSIAHVQTWLEQVNAISQDTAQQATAANEAVQKGQVAIQKGKEDMNAVGKGIKIVQKGTDQIAKRTQTLTNYVELANQFAKDQKRTAAMTRILAMNASMLASRASTQQDPEQFASITREFEVVAAQVNELAVQTNQSLVVLKQRTDQIQTVVTGLDHDVQDISQQVEDFSEVVGQSHQIFDTLQSMTQQVAQIEQHVAQSSQTIVETTQSATQMMSTVSANLGETASQASVAREHAQQLEQLATGLLQKIEFFNIASQTIEVSSSNEMGMRPTPLLVEASARNGIAPKN